MNKIINIDPVHVSSNKNHTKKKDDLQKKAEINAIMEKYNLKPSKKSKINENSKTEYVIKPKNDSQIIHIVKDTNRNIKQLDVKPEVKPAPAPAPPLQNQQQQQQQQQQQ